MIQRTIKGFAYRNLHFPGVVYSVKVNGKVLLHSNNIVVENAEFIVHKAGQAKVRKEKRKQVHAFVKGDIVVDPLKLQNLKFKNKTAYYNPYKTDTFVDMDGNPIYKARYVLLTSKDDRTHLEVIV
jgi:hypothetical protein